MSTLSRSLNSVPSSLAQLAADHEMEQLLLRAICGHRQFLCGRAQARRGQRLRELAVCGHARDRPAPHAGRGRPRPARRAPDRAGCRSGRPSSAVITPPASCTKRSAAARSQSWLLPPANAARASPCATRASRNASECTFGCGSDARSRACDDPVQHSAWARRCVAPSRPRRRSP